MRTLIKLLLVVVCGVLIGSATNDLALQVKQERREVQARELIESDIARYKIAPHVVKMEITLPNGIMLGSGTGFYVEFMGKIVLMTNKHICDPNKEEGMDIRVKGKVMQIVAISTIHDLCILKSDREQGMKLARIDTVLEVLDKVILVGHPRGLPITVREGRVMTIDQSKFSWLDNSMKEFFMISTIAYGGNSGSPVSNTKGEVIGVLFAGPRNFHTEGLVVPLVDIYVFLSSNYKLY